MHRRSARFLLFATAMVLFVAGPSLSGPRVAPKPRPADQARTVPEPRVAPAPRAAPEPRVAPEPHVAPEPRVVPGAPVTLGLRDALGRDNAPAPRVASGPGTTAGAQVAPVADPTPGGPASTCGDRGEVTYVVPVGLAPVTNRNTCRGQGRECCGSTMEWCLGEGFYWQGCEDCYCGFQCMAPALFE